MTAPTSTSNPPTHTPSASHSRVRQQTIPQRDRRRTALPLRRTGLEYHPATHNRLFHPPLDLPSTKGCVSTLRTKLARVNLPLFVLIDDHHIGIRTNRKRSLLESERIRWTRGELLNRFLQRQHTFFHQPQSQGERCLKPHNPEWSFRKILLLLLRGMRRMVGRDRIDRAIAQSFLDRVDIIPCTQRRIHLRMGVVS